MIKINSPVSYFLELSEYVQTQNFKVKCEVGPWNMDSNGCLSIALFKACHVLENIAGMVPYVCA